MECRAIKLHRSLRRLEQRPVCGAIDPLKLKGLKFTKGYAAVVWFEELDQFDGIDAVRYAVMNDVPRG